MKLGRVIGTVVSSTVVEGVEGVKLLIVQPLDKRQRPKGLPLVAGDGLRMAGPGELVYYVSSREAALAMPENTFVPIDDAIVGIVDDVQLADSARSGD